MTPPGAELSTSGGECYYECFRRRSNHNAITRKKWFCSFQRLLHWVVWTFTKHDNLFTRIYSTIITLSNVCIIQMLRSVRERRQATSVSISLLYGITSYKRTFLGMFSIQYVALYMYIEASVNPLGSALLNPDMILLSLIMEYFDSAINLNWSLLCSDCDV